MTKLTVLNCGAGLGITPKPKQKTSGELDLPEDLMDFYDKYIQARQHEQIVANEEEHLPLPSMAPTSGTPVVNDTGIHLPLPVMNFANPYGDQQQPQHTSDDDEIEHLPLPRMVFNRRFEQ